MRKTWLAVGTLTVCACLMGTEAWAQRGIAHGRVVDENGQAVAGVTLTIEFQGGFERKYETKTDKKGAYTQIVTPGPYRLTAMKDGYQGAYLEHTIETGGRTTVPDLRITSQEKAIAAAIEKDAVLGPLKRAMELTEAGKLDEAETAYREVLTADPSVAEAHYNLGSIHLSRNELDAAAVEFGKVVELRPDSEQAYGALSRVYEQKGDVERAIDVMAKGVAVRPDDPRMRFDLGILYFNARRTEEAAGAFRKVEALDPKNSRIHYLLATLALNRGDVEEAVARLEKYLAMSPEDAPDRDTAKGLLAQLRPAPTSEP